MRLNGLLTTAQAGDSKGDHGSKTMSVIACVHNDLEQSRQLLGSESRFNGDHWEEHRVLQPPSDSNRDEKYW